MKITKTLIRLAGLSVLLIVTALVFVQIRAKRVTAHGSSLLAGPLPSNGLALNNTNGDVPGDPKATVEKMKRIYALLKVYMAKHGGEYPRQLGIDVIDHPTDYGLPDPHAPGCDDRCFYNRMKSNFSVFTSPDAKYADDSGAREQPEHTSVFQMQDKRPDGSKVGSPKSPGTRDVLIATNLYVHNNARLYPGERSTSNPVGFYLILWDDGNVEKISYDKILYVPTGGADYHYAFPGQAGIPTNALTYDAFYKLHNKNAVPPRGGPNQPGRDYRGKTL